MNKKILFLGLFLFSFLSFSMKATKGFIPVSDEGFLLRSKNTDSNTIQLLEKAIAAVNSGEFDRGELTGSKLKAVFRADFMGEEGPCYGERVSVSDLGVREILQQIPVNKKERIFPSPDLSGFFNESCPERAEGENSCDRNMAGETELLEDHFGMEDRHLTMVSLVSGDSDFLEEVYHFENGGSLRIISIGKAGLFNGGNSGFQPSTIKDTPWHPLPTPPLPFSDEELSSCMSL